MAPGLSAFRAKDAKALDAKGMAAATSGWLVVGIRASLLSESFLNRRLHRRVQALVSAATCTPLSHGVNTCAHGDHSFCNMHLPPTTRIDQHVDAKAAIEKHLGDDLFVWEPGAKVL